MYNKLCKEDFEFKFHVGTAHPAFYLVISGDAPNGKWEFYREEEDGEVWGNKQFNNLSEAFAHFADEYKLCGQ